MKIDMRSFKLLVIGTAAVLLVAVPSMWAKNIRLNDGTTIDGDVVRVNDDTVFISIDRGLISAIDGKPLPEAIKEASAAPSFLAQDIKGNALSVGKDSGKVTLLHFWVHWCPHCRSDSPKLQSLYDEFKSNPKFQFVTVNMDEKRSFLDQFIAERHVTYPVIFSEEQRLKPNGIDIPTLYQISGFPVTFLIDANGVIRHKFGGSFAETGKDLSQLISALLK